MADQGATVLAAERGGTSARVEALWRDVGGPLRAFVAHHVAGAQDADDVVAEVFLRVAARIDDVRDDERLVGWVYRIARNAIVDHYRSAPRRREVLTAAPPERVAAFEGAGFGPDDDAAAETRAALVGCLRPALDSLPTEAREALELTELGGLTQAEAAARLGLSVSGMKSRVQRARQRVRAMIEDCCALVFDGRGAPIERQCRTACCPA